MTFWFENPSVLLSNFSLIPHGNLEDKSNNLTQLVIILGLFLGLYNIKLSMKFIIYMLMFIIILYYLKKDNMIQENYESISDFNNFPAPNSAPGVDRFHPQMRPNAQEVTGQPDYSSPNAQLFGVNSQKVLNNPRYTNQAIYRTDPIYRNSRYSQLNEQGNEYLYESGYALTEPVPSFNFYGLNQQENGIKEGFNDGASYNTEYIDPLTTVQYDPQPLQSNIGIDGTPQYETDNSYSLDLSGYNDQANEANTFDPRSTGYGTNYRGYIHPMTGNRRFYYKDIDNVKMMRGVVGRSNIDHIINPWDTPMSEIEIREKINKARTDSEIERRNEYRDRYMRKYNSQVGWQRKMAPLRRDHGTWSKY